MEDSILISTKKVLGLDGDYNVFDLDICSHANLAFATLNDLGVGPTEGFVIEDDSALWSDLDMVPQTLSMVKTYVFLKTRMLFDPPTVGFLVDATKTQIAELEWRLSTQREGELL